MHARPPDEFWCSQLDGPHGQEQLWAVFKLAPRTNGLVQFHESELGSRQWFHRRLGDHLARD